MLCNKIRLTVCDNKYHDRLMSESLLWGKLLHSLFASLLSFALSSKIQPKVCYREEFNRCKDAWTRFASNLILWRNLQQMCCGHPC